MTWSPPSKVGDTDPTISDAKGKLRANYGYAHNLDDTDIYTAEFAKVLQEYASRINDQIRKGVRPGPYVTTTGVYDWTVKTQLGLIHGAPQPPPPPAHRPIYLFSAPGSGATNTVGPANDVGSWAEVVLHINHRRLNFPMGGYMGLMGGDPTLSYDDVIDAEGADLEVQIAQAIRDEGMDPDDESTWLDTLIEFWFAAYSQSSDGMKKAVNRLFGKGGRFEKLRARINGLLLFGDPSRQRGPVKGQGPGYNPPGYGIARWLAPAWLEKLTYSITTNGDMYACTQDDTMLPEFYAWFVKAKWSFGFIEFSAGLIIPALASYLGIAGPLLGGIFGAAGAGIIGAVPGVGLPFMTQILGGGAVDDPEISKLRDELSAQGLLSVGGITKLFKTLAALPGIQTHGEYWIPKPEFGGRTGIQVACDIMASFRR
jgi:hypothetical protein